MSGILSCIAMNPDFSGMFAVGSYSRSVGLYDERTDQMFRVLDQSVGAVTQVSILSAFCSHHLIVLQIVFSEDGNFMYTAARLSSEIQCWDLRGTGEVLATYHREALTNQRIQFATRDGVLFTGQTDGQIKAFSEQGPQLFPIHQGILFAVFVYSCSD